MLSQITGLRGKTEGHDQSISSLQTRIEALEKITDHQGLHAEQLRTEIDSLRSDLFAKQQSMAELKSNLRGQKISAGIAKAKLEKSKLETKKSRNK